MNEKTQTIALTGASGFVGTHILRDLLEKKYTVKTLVRSTSRTKTTHRPDDHSATACDTVVDHDGARQSSCERTPKSRLEASCDNDSTRSIPDSEQERPNPLQTEGHDTKVIEGDLFNNASLEKLVDGASVVIHLVGIIREVPSKGVTFERVHVEGTENLLRAAKKAGVKRWIQMSALGTKDHASSKYHRTKRLAELAVMKSGLDWTIFRPSLIHGPDGEFMLMVKDFFTKGLAKGGMPFVPYFGKGILGGGFGGGAGLVQPVWVEDVAAMFVEAVENKQTIGQIYDVAGADRMSWPQMYEICQKYIAGAKHRPAVGVPSWFAKKVAGIAERVGVTSLPFGKDQVLMAEEDNVANDAELERLDRDLGIKRSGFEEVVKKYGPTMT
ncbi:short chain dehydrogenase [Poriferisphaera corsica]|uniref:Short chain dehydrogenase n=1 Tax=Poriferisphaera corsica TaxID=2528020 RepID=A0A517YY69_9BACT|nr:NAD(P)H-binding protein [Poriferisphaera corsica]QDU35168.1 short chain dehydrogenase [Poriferisphaera corsica]